MSAPPADLSPLLTEPGLRHGFFNRRGGVSTGLYASLNAGPGSEDDPDAVAENRRRCAAMLGTTGERLLTCYQIHSPDVLIVDTPWPDGPEKADAMVTREPGLAIGVLTADCMPWLFADPEARIIGAAHAGWRGALAGVLENTVAAMEKLGADRTRIRAALGPSLRQQNFEVGLELLEAFTAKHPQSKRFFASGLTEDKRMLDLAGFGAWRLRESGLSEIDDLGACTLAEPAKFFSYRATRRAGEPDYGRNLSAIVLEP